MSAILIAWAIVLSAQIFASTWYRHVAGVVAHEEYGMNTVSWLLLFGLVVISVGAA